jgi:DNA-binding NarL/FixJ family response regulator
MKIVLVGTPAARARLRPELAAIAALEVVGEAPSLALAAEIEADAVLFAPPEPDGTSEELTPELLTHRELEVLDLLAEGLPNRAIAARLGISDQTVKFHVASLSGKLGAINRTDAVRRAVRKGILGL